MTQCHSTLIPYEEKAQHAYDIINTKTGEIVKTGVSGGSIRNGKSVRAETQVRKWNREHGETVFESVITKQIPEGEGARAKIYEYEKKRACELKTHEMLKDPYYHQRP